MSLGIMSERKLEFMPWFRSATHNQVQQRGKQGMVVWRMPQSTLVMSRSSDEGIDCMPQEDFDVVEALHAELEVKTNMDSISIISDPIKASINAPNLMKEVNGVVNSVPNQTPTSELFEFQLKGLMRE